MTETTDTAPLDDALSLIDGTLLDLQGRELVAASEVSDLLLDLRMLLARQPVEVAAATGCSNTVPCAANVSSMKGAVSCEYP